MMGSRYVVPADAGPDPTGQRPDSRIYGAFPGCSVLDYSCTIHVEELPNRVPVADILGRTGVFSRGGLAIHISGRDSFGAQTGPGTIRALGRYRVEWARDYASTPSGLGCREPEPAVIVSWDGDDGSGHDDDRWAHIVHWGCVRGYLTAWGLYREAVARGLPVFTANNVLEWIDERRQSRRWWRLAGDKQHITTVRRLCEHLVSHDVVGSGWGLERRGRWSYQLCE
jgi:hypothetical protein